MPTYAPLVWDNTGEKKFETGTKKGVLFVMNDDGTYRNGVAWNGLTSVSLSNSGADETALWADDIKYASLRSAEEFGATIEAYQCPREFYECDGTAEVVPGMYVGQQTRRSFGFSYVTTIGNDVQGNDYGYKIHLIYNASANPSERSYQTINESPDAITLSWEITTTPVAFTGYKNVAHIEIDSTKFTTEAQRAALKDLEDQLWGSESNNSTLPSPADVKTYLTVSTS